MNIPFMRNMEESTRIFAKSLEVDTILLTFASRNGCSSGSRC